MGNRLTKVTGAISEVYSYDNNGNIKSDGTRTFVCNQNNRLVRVEVGATVLGEYAYDAFGRRVKKVASGVTTIYDYDVAGNLINESEVDGTPLRDIVYMNGERVAMRLYGSQAGWYYFVNDHLGTPRKVVDVSGSVVWQADYLPFGKAQVLSGSTIVNNFRFPGQYYDAETGLHYNWYRYYIPAKGRYLTPDPVGLAAGINIYIYVLNNPINNIDPSGFQKRGGRGGSRGGELGPRTPYTDMEARGLIREIQKRDPGFGMIRRNCNDEYDREDVEDLRERLREIRERERMERKQKCQPRKRSRGRIQSMEDAQNQLEGIGEARRYDRRAIESIKKSEDNFRNQGKGKTSEQIFEEYGE